MIKERLRSFSFQFTVPGDKSALNPSGIRLGTPPLTTRRFREKEMGSVVGFIHRALELASEIQKESGPKLVDWKRCLENGPGYRAKVADLKAEVEEFARNFPMPGCEEF